MLGSGMQFLNYTMEYAQPLRYRKNVICDMIKGNESLVEKFTFS